MRISTSWSYQVSVNTMLTQQSDLSKTQMQISTGNQYLTPSDNPYAAATLLNFNDAIQTTKQYQTNIDAAQTKLQLEGSTINNVISVMQTIRELTVQGLNATNTQQNRGQIANQIDQLNKQLLSLSNAKDANGEFIFAGNLTNQPAYSSSGPPTNTFTYNGDVSQRSIVIGPDNRQLAVNDSGPTVFGAISTGTLTAGSISNAFQAVQQISNDLNAGTPNSTSLTDMDSILSNLETVNASVGSKLQILTSQQSINQQTLLDNQKIASQIGDTNLPQAISQLQLQQTTLQAAQQAFAKVENLSLFQFLG
jgi:flagellar hook-associated protein 3 FlgL